MSLTVGSLFSGIGGLDLGLERAGMEIVGQVEIEDYCRKILDLRWPETLKDGDVRRFDPRYFPRVDLLAGGPPCQPVSAAGLRRAQADERWLWPDFARAVRILRPRYTLMENPPGLLARGMGDVLGTLAALGHGIEWESLPAAAFGALQRRFRVFIVAHLGGEGLALGEGVFGYDGQELPSVERDYRPPLTDLDCLQSVEQELIARCGGEAFPGPSSPDPHRERELQPPGPEPEERGRFDDGSWWAAEPRVARMVYGVPHGMDRIKGLGNSVMPQVAEWIGRRIVEHAEAIR